MSFQKHIKKKYCFSIQIIIIACSLTTQTAFAEFNTIDFYPLELNPEYTVQIKGSLSTEIITVQKGTTTINSVATKRVDFSDGSRTYYSNDSNGLFFHQLYIPDPDLGTMIATFNPPLKYLEAQMIVGQIISDTTPVSLLIPGLGTFIFSYTINTEIKSSEQVTVPMNTFTALKLIVTTSLSGNIFGSPVSSMEQDIVWVAEGIGEVKTQNLASGEIEELINVRGLSQIIFNLP